jgi:hypothetical protein
MYTLLLLTSVLLADTLELRGRSVSLHIGAPTCNAFASGAAGDGLTDDTAALQRAINLCSTSSGGTIVLPANGTFLSRALALPSSARGTALRIEGTLRFSNDTKAWGKVPSPCLTLAGADIALLGAGTVDGQGAAWWPCAKAGCARPTLVYSSASNLLVASLRFLNSPNHNLELYSSPQEVAGVTILAPPSTGTANPSHNTDGIGEAGGGGVPTARSKPERALPHSSHPPPHPPPLLQTCTAPPPTFTPAPSPLGTTTWPCTPVTL